MDREAWQATIYGVAKTDMMERARARAHTHTHIHTHRITLYHIIENC